MGDCPLLILIPIRHSDTAAACNRRSGNLCRRCALYTTITAQYSRNNVINTHVKRRPDLSTQYKDAAARRQPRPAKSAADVMLARAPDEIHDEVCHFHR